MRIAVFGAGAWGTALALAFSRGHEIVLWSRESDEISAMRADGENRRYLPGIPLPRELHVRGGDVDNVDVKRLRALPNVEYTTKGWEMFAPMASLLLNQTFHPISVGRWRHLHVLSLQFLYLVRLYFLSLDIHLIEGGGCFAKYHLQGLFSSRSSQHFCFCLEADI